MSLLLAVATGYLIGSAPTANALASLWGVDLLSGGSGNPGANNARRLGGPLLALLVLAVEAAKGVIAVVAGMALAGDTGAAAAGVAAVAGNVYNVWYSFRGGKGLGISLGVLLAAWPGFVPVAMVVLGISASLSRSTGIGSLVTMAVAAVAPFFWPATGEPWGLAEEGALMVLGVGLPVILFQRHWRDARARLRRPAPL